MSRYCSQCGTENTEKDAAFCGKCGAKLQDASAGAQAENQQSHQPNAVTTPQQPPHQMPPHQMPPQQMPPQQKKKKASGCLIAILIVVVCFVMFIVSLFGPNGSVSRSNSSLPTATSQVEQQQEVTATPKTPKLELLEHSPLSEGGIRYITGKIKNNTNKTYTYAQVTINLYNDELQVGSTLDNINNLEPGSTWEFKAIILSKDANTYKITDVTGW